MGNFSPNANPPDTPPPKNANKPPTKKNNPPDPTNKANTSHDPRRPEAPAQRRISRQPHHGVHQLDLVLGLDAQPGLGPRHQLGGEALHPQHDRLRHGGRLEQLGR